MWIPYLIGFVPMRILGGGHHAKTHFSCILFFSTFYLLFIFLKDIFQSFPHIEIFLCLAPDGIIYKCISGIGMDEYKVGHISTYGTRKYYNRLAELIELPNPCTNAQCHSCDYSLICDGGCVFKSMKYGWHCQHNSLLNGNVKLLHYQAIHDINQAR